MADEQTTPKETAKQKIPPELVKMRRMIVVRIFCALIVEAWAIPANHVWIALVAAGIIGHEIGAWAFVIKIASMVTMTDEIKAKIPEIVQSHSNRLMQQHLEQREEFDLAIRRAAAEACSTFAVEDAEEMEKEDDRATEKPGKGNAVALTSFEDLAKEEEQVPTRKCTECKIHYAMEHLGHDVGDDAWFCSRACFVEHFGIDPENQE